MKYNLEKLDEEIKKIYNKSNYENKIFEEAYLKLSRKKKSKLSTYLKLAACILTIGIIGMISITMLHKKSTVIYNNDTANNDTKKTDTLLSDISSAPTVQLPNGLSYVDYSVLNEAECVAIVKLDKILYGTNYIPKTNSYVYPVTVSNFTIEKTFKGNLTGQIKLATDTETLLSIDDYAKGGFIEDAKRLGYDKMSEEERKNTYVTMPTIRNYTKLKEGNYYIAYMKYHNDAELYSIVNYCFFEYNKDTNEVKIPETNTWEEFELDGYDDLFIS